MSNNRKWESDDTKWFFEALCEHGKDFQSIQTYIASRSEKKKGSQKSANSAETIKSREQVRHYYYRTWHKIASSLHFTEDIFQQTKELYGLINYGEIWKKFGAKFNSKIKMHLNELVFNGQTIVKIKGKNVKLKTPVCKALKKIHKVEDKKTSPSAVDVSNLPKEVYIELHPADNSAWLRVHSLTQNPRLRVKLPLQKRLSSLISYLERRWSEQRLRALESETFSVDFQNVQMKSSSAEFRVRPHPNMLNELKNVVIKRTPINFSSQVDLSLSAFIEKMYKNNETEPEKKTKKSSVSSTSKAKAVEDECGSIQQSDCDSTSLTLSDDALCKVSEQSEETSEPKSVPPIDETVRSLSLLKDMLASVDENVSDSSKYDESSLEPSFNKTSDMDCESVIESSKCTGSTLPLPPPDEKIGEWLSASIPKSSEVESEADKTETKVSNAPMVPEKGKDGPQVLDVETVKKGWTSTDMDITIGELYLMMQQPKKVLLEYSWVPLNSESLVTQGSEKLEMCNNGVIEAQANSSNDTSVLSRLMVAASLALMNVGKQEELSNSLSPTKSTKNASRKNKRLKANSPPPTTLIPSLNLEKPSSAVLSNVISTTILSDTCREKAEENKLNVENGDSREKYSFAVPVSPAPKNVRKPVKSRAVCGDRTMIEEAIRQLNSNRYQTRKHPRKARPKPVITQKPLLPRCPGILNSLTSLPPPILNQVVSQTFSSTNLHTNQGSTSCSTDIGNRFQIPVVIPSSQHIVVSPANCHSVPVNVGHVLSATKQTLLSAMIGTPLISSAVPFMQPSCSSHENNFLVKEATVPAPAIETTSDATVISKASTASSLTSNSSSTAITNDAVAMPACRGITSSSPPNLSCLLDMSLSEHPLFGDNSCSSLSDAIGFSTLNKDETASSSSKASFKNLVAPIETNTGLGHTSADRLVSVVESPSKLSNSQNCELKTVSLPETWLNGDSSELSLGALFNAPESLTKLEDSSNKSSAFMANVDIDTQMSLNTLVNDNSVDLVAKFADLADRINETELIKSETT